MIDADVSKQEALVSKRLKSCWYRHIVDLTVSTLAEWHYGVSFNSWDTESSDNNSELRGAFGELRIFHDRMIDDNVTCRIISAYRIRNPIQVEFHVLVFHREINRLVAFLKGESRNQYVGTIGTLLTNVAHFPSLQEPIKRSSSREAQLLLIESQLTLLKEHGLPWLEARSTFAGAVKALEESANPSFDLRVPSFELIAGYLLAERFEEARITMEKFLATRAKQEVFGKGAEGRILGICTSKEIPIDLDVLTMEPRYGASMPLDDESNLIDISQLKTGLRIKHPKFGAGVVSKIFGHGLVEIKFDEVGTRTLDTLFAKLSPTEQ